MKPKIALYYDSLWIKGGAERVVCQLANELDADLITSGFNPEIKKWLNLKVPVIDIGNSSIRWVKDIGILLESPVRFFFFKPKKKYDIHLFMGYNSIFAAKKEETTLWFCLTPNRILYDNRELKASKGSWIRKLFFHTYQYIFTPLDQKAVTNIDSVIAQTKEIKKRIQKYYSLSSEIIYSPVQTNSFYFKSYGDFYLTIGRLVPEKRIDLIAKVFTTLPDKELVIVGDGPELKNIQNIIQGHANIKLITSASDEELQDLYATCLATIYLPMKEDFGLVPVESMASGKICIAANEGGCLETIENGKTGILIEPTFQNLLSCIQNLDLDWVTSQKAECKASALKFDIRVCIAKWKIVIENSQKQ